MESVKEQLARLEQELEITLSYFNTLLEKKMQPSTAEIVKARNLNYQIKSLKRSM